LKKLKVIISLILILVFTQASILAAPRIPVYKVGNVYYFLDKSTGTITGFAGEPKDITIPAELGGYKVISIGHRAFAGSPTLTSVTIPEGITTISAEAFAECGSLSSVNISSTVSYIGNRAFADCKNLSHVNVSGIPGYIDSAAFDNTNWVVDSNAEFVILGNTLLQYNGFSETVYVPYGVKSIAANTFAYNTTVKEIILPDTVDKIGDNAFVHCINLEKITIPTTVSHIGAGAFDDTMWIDNYDSEFVTVNGILVHYKGNSPRNSSHIYIPDGITAIGSGAFMTNESLRSVYIPDSVIYIDSMAFGSCRELRLVNIPYSVEWIDEYAFSGCDKVTLHVPSGSYAKSFAKYMDIPYSAPVGVCLNEEKLHFENAAPIIKDGRTYVPLRALMEMMEYTVSWDSLTSNITCTKGDDVVLITSNGEITVNGVVSELKATPINVNGSNVVPGRFLSEAVEATVEWNEETRTVEITY